VFALVAGCLLQGEAKSDLDAPFGLQSRNAALTQFRLSGHSLPLQKVGGFVVQDFVTKEDVRLKGAVSSEGETQIYTAKGMDVELRAVFEPKDGFIEVSGEVLSTTSEDRAILLRYTVPVASEGAVFGNVLSRNQVIDAGSEELGTYVPIAAMTGEDWGVSLSVPPDFPCCFGMTGTKAGLGLEFYLGMTPETKAFPNRAQFRFVIDTAEPGWGFRSAFARYYDRYAEYYSPRFEGSGFWNWNDAAFLHEEESIVDEALPLYKVHGMPRGARYPTQAQRDRRHGVIPFAYMIVGQREIIRLPEVPKDYDSAMAVFSDFEKQWNEEGPEGELHKKYSRPISLHRNLHLPEQIRNSTIFDLEGRYRMLRRSSVWGAGSVTFIQNPNPDLFNDRDNAHTVGSVSLKELDAWIQQDSVDGIHMDSLGVQWPRWINYRRDHFPYARYPLTFDAEGRIGLHNMVSHYEFLEDLRCLALKYDKYLFGNGIDIYMAPEHYNSVMNGRFFLFATMDAAGREITDDVMDRERLEAVRTFMGHKLLTVLLYKWKDPKRVKEQMNRALAYNVFAAPNRFFEDKISYFESPDGFARDRELLTWLFAEIPDALRCRLAAGNPCCR